MIAVYTTTTITSDSPDPSRVGEPYTVSVTVAPVSPATGVPSGTVLIIDGDGNTCTVTLAAGSGSCNLASTSAGPKTLTATYSSDANFNASAGNASHQVDKGDTTTTINSDLPDPSRVGEPYTVSVTVSPVSPATGVPSGSVLVSDGNGALSGSGTYRLTLAKTGDPVVVSAGDEGGPMTNGVMHLGTVLTGDLDLWTFSANSGDALVVRIGKLTDSFRGRQ